MPYFPLPSHPLPTFFKIQTYRDIHSSSATLGNTTSISSPQPIYLYLQPRRMCWYTHIQYSCAHLTSIRKRTCLFTQQIETKHNWNRPIEGSERLRNVCLEETECILAQLTHFPCAAYYREDREQRQDEGRAKASEKWSGKKADDEDGVR